MEERGSPRSARARLRSLPWTVLLLCVLPGALRAQLPAPAASSGLPFHVGGYGGAVLNTPSLEDWGDPRFNEANASLLVSGTPWRRFAYFGELDGASRSDENYAHVESERTLDLERLYGEFTVSDAFRVRVGRFLTPIGQWNELHAEPLTWTSVRPLTTYRSFAKSSTGVLLAGEGAPGGREAGWALYLARSTRGHEEHEVRFDDVLGGRAALEVRDAWWLGASAAVLRERRPRVDDDVEEAETPAEEQEELALGEDDISDRSPRALFGLDARALVRGAELSSEATLLSPLGSERTEWGAFGQAAIPILGPWYAVGRIERFSPRVGAATTTGTLGSVVRPRSWITLKVERQLAPDSAPLLQHGWFLSASVLF